MILKVIDAYSTAFTVVPAVDFGNNQVVSYVALLTSLSALSVTIGDGDSRVDESTGQPTDIKVYHNNQVYVKVQFAFFRRVEFEQQVN